MVCHAEGLADQSVPTARPSAFAPVLLRPCHWELLPFEKTYTLPNRGLSRLILIEYVIFCQRRLPTYSMHASRFELRQEFRNNTLIHPYFLHNSNLLPSLSVSPFSPVFTTTQLADFLPKKRFFFAYVSPFDMADIAHLP